MSRFANGSGRNLLTDNSWRLIPVLFDAGDRFALLFWPWQMFLANVTMVDDSLLRNHLLWTIYIFEGLLKSDRHSYIYFWYFELMPDRVKKYRTQNTKTFWHFWYNRYCRVDWITFRAIYNAVNYNVACNRSSLKGKGIPVNGHG